jgi:flagellin
MKSLFLEVKILFVQVTSLLHSFGKVTDNKSKKDNVIEKISSGKKINRAADDAAGLSISQSFKAQVRGLSVAEKNAQDGISMLQVADGALGDISEHLHRMKEITVQACNGTLTNNDRQASDKEIQSIKNSIETIAENTHFNGIKLLDSDKSLTLQIRDNPDTFYTINLFDNKLSSLGLSEVSVTTFDNATKCLKKIDASLNKIISNRSAFGGDLNNLQSAVNDAQNSVINTTSSLSKIEDIDMATAVMKSVKDGILYNSNNFMLASTRQSNERINVVLNKWLSS